MRFFMIVNDLRGDLSKGDFLLIFILRVVNNARLVTW